MFFRKKKALLQYPHEIFPEIRLWEKGDEVDYGLRRYRFEAIKENGDIVLYWYGDLDIIDIKTAKSEAKNVSLKNRNIKSEMSEDKYMEFLQDFRKAYDEAKNG